MFYLIGRADSTDTSDDVLQITNPPVKKKHPSPAKKQARRRQFLQDIANELNELLQVVSKPMMLATSGLPFVDWARDIANGGNSVRIARKKKFSYFQFFYDLFIICIYLFLFYFSACRFCFCFSSRFHWNRSAKDLVPAPRRFLVVVLFF